MYFHAPAVPHRKSICHSLLLCTAVAVVAACSDAAGDGWQGTIDTLENGTILVENPKTGIWKDGEEWQIVEEVRIGSAEGDGPEVFGRITDYTVDAEGRFYVFDGEAQDLRVFGVDGEHVRTIGRKGAGPGEFNQVMGMDWALDGTLWLVDPNNNRVSVFDTSGVFVEGLPTQGGFMMWPWPGGFDDQGRFYTPGYDTGEGGIRFFLIQMDENLQPADTILFPDQPGDPEMFKNESGNVSAGIPFTPSLSGYFLRRTNYYWFALTGEYDIYQRTLDGDTIRIISKMFEPVPVTAEDIDSAVTGLDWFTRQGGRIDRSKFPTAKPAISNFIVDNQGNIWVFPYILQQEDVGRVVEVFDPQGRYLGRARLPFAVPRQTPRPQVQNGVMYAVLLDDLDVPYLVRARIVKPESGP